MILKALVLVHNSETNITRLHIDSPGGTARSGIILGTWVYKNKIKVTIDNLCFSSCANYIFTAANEVHINKGALLGWHGGAFQKYFTVYMRWYEYFIPNRKAKKEAYVKLSQVSWRNEETAFFKMINVDQKITTYGQLELYNCQTSTGAHGFNYSLADLKKMGIRNITMDDSDFLLSSADGKITSCRVTLSP